MRLRFGGLFSGLFIYLFIYFIFYLFLFLSFFLGGGGGRGERACYRNFTVYNLRRILYTTTIQGNHSNGLPIRDILYTNWSEKKLKSLNPGFKSLNTRKLQ